MLAQQIVQNVSLETRSYRDITINKNYEID